MLTCDVCKVRSKEVAMHAWAFGRWLPFCPECWARLKDPETLYETLSEEMDA